MAVSWHKPLEVTGIIVVKSRKKHISDITCTLIEPYVKTILRKDIPYLIELYLSCYPFIMEGDHNIVTKVSVFVSLRGKNVLKVLKYLDRDSAETPKFWGDLGLCDI